MGFGGHGYCQNQTLKSLGNTTCMLHNSPYDENAELSVYNWPVYPMSQIRAKHSMFTSRLNTVHSNKVKTQYIHILATGENVHSNQGKTQSAQIGAKHSLFKSGLNMVCTRNATTHRWDTFLSCREN